MSSKLRTKLNKALKMEEEIVESIIKSSIQNLIIKAKVSELCNSTDCYEIIQKNKIRGEEYTMILLNKT
jgi:hypothetical protein